MRQTVTILLQQFPKIMRSFMKIMQPFTKSLSFSEKYSIFSVRCKNLSANICHSSAVFAGCRTRLIKARIKCIEILCIQFFLHRTQRFPEPLEMNHFSCSQEPDRICDLRDITHYAENIVISCPGLLFWGDFVRTTLHNII